MIRSIISYDSIALHLELKNTPERTANELKRVICDDERSSFKGQRFFPKPEEGILRQRS